MDHDAHEGLKAGRRSDAARAARRAYEARVAQAIARARLRRRIMRWLLIGAGAMWIGILIRQLTN